MQTFDFRCWPVRVIFMFHPEMEILLITLTVEQREIAEDRLHSWEEVLSDEGSEVTHEHRIATLHLIIAEFKR